MDSLYVGMWSLIYDTIRAFWALTEPRIKDAARDNNMPIELYYYGELGLEIFSLARFQKRDPYSNPAQFQQAFENLAAEEWIVPQTESEFRVTERARDAARTIVRVGDSYLGTLEVIAAGEAERTKSLLERIVAANHRAAEPPYKWATRTRFRVAEDASPQLAQIREALMDLFAYRDDSHMSAWLDYPISGIAWDAFGMIWGSIAFTPEQIAAEAWFRGYAATDYRRALDELEMHGWIVTAPLAFNAAVPEPAAFDEYAQLTPIGKKLRDAVEELTDAYFYAPWIGLDESEIQDLRLHLIELRNQLSNASG